MAPFAPFCPLRESAGHGDCRHCQRSVDRFLDLTDWQRLEADRQVFDFEAYADSGSDDPVAA